MFRQIQIIAVGKTKTDYLEPALAHYSQRLQSTTNLSWHFVPPANLTPKQDPDSLKSRAEESQKILAYLNKQDLSATHIFLLDEKGQQFSSPQFAQTIQTSLNQGQSNAIFIIGGAHGVSKQLYQFVSSQGLVWSLSQLVFPHQLVRLLLLEQLYRAQSILAGSHYHHQ